MDYMSTSDDRWSAFGRWVRERRVALDIGPMEAAKRAKVARQHWNRLEKGESGTHYETIPRIAAAIDADLVETYERAGYRAPENIRPPGTDESLATRLECILRKAPVQKRAQLENAIEQLATVLVTTAG